MLEHLILSPQNGLCNRLRAIAAARRICRRFEAKCSVVWDWGDFWRFFAPLADLKIVRFRPLCGPRMKRMHGVAADLRAIDVRAPTVKVRSGVAFWASDEPRIHNSELRDFYPRLHPRLEEVARDFTAARLTSAVGMHIRRTDNEQSIRASPDRLFIEEGAEIVGQGKQIFLATDNLATERMMVERFGDSVVTYPRRKIMAQRWPRTSFDPVALEDDLLDLFLLGRTEYVLGSRWSSFSGLAMAMNGSPLCRQLGSQETGGARQATGNHPDDETL